MKYLKLLLGAYLLVIIYGCVRFPCGDELSCWVEYNFSLGYESDPPIREISVGDTFTISMEIPHRVEDTETGEIYNIEDLNYTKIFSMSLMDTSNNTYISAPANSFEFFSLDNDIGFIDVTNLGGFTKNVNLSLANFEEHKAISFNVIANKEGLYWADLFYDSSQLEEFDGITIDLTDTCCAERVKLVHEYLSVENNNKDLIPDLKQWGDVTAGGTTPAKRVDLDDPEVEKNGIFFFRVVD